MQLNLETFGFNEMLAGLEKTINSLSNQDITGVVGTTVEYAIPVEYGSTQKHDREARRPDEEQGIFDLPKGGKSDRNEYKTIVTQPAQAMVRTSIPTVEKQLLENLRNMPGVPTDNDLEEAISDATLRAQAEIAQRTPVDTGALKASWKARIFRGGAD